MKNKSTMIGFLIIVMITSGLFAASSTSAVANITVTTTTDSISADGQCSLREAILSSNADSAVGGCLAGSGADIIHFDPSLTQPAIFILTLTGAGEDNAATGDLDITSVITIQGTGQNQIIVDGNSADRVFDVLLGANLTLSGVTVRNGNPGAGAEGSGIRSAGRLTFSDGIATLNQGNGITNNGGLTVLTNVNVMNNQGYGIHNFNLGVLTYTGGEVSGNQKGGIYNTVATATLTGISVLNNTGTGGIANVGSATSRLTVTNSIVKGNLSSVNGGGIRNDGAQNIADIRNTNISSNQAAIAGGGVFNFGILVLIGNTIENNNARTGGGVDHFGGQISMSNDTISGNAATDDGGGLYNRDSATLVNVTLSGNTASGQGTGGNLFNDTASISIKNTILANSDIDGNCFNSGGFLNSLGNNLDSGNTCGFTQSGDLVDTNPMLGTLQDNGGTTFTLALLAGSPAINAGTNTGCPQTDQRGVARPQGINCDMGAFELELSSAHVKAYIAGNNVGDYTILLGDSITDRYVLNGGPVHVVSTDGTTPIFASERAVFGSSFNSIVGYPANQLTTDYWFTSYDDVGMLTYLVIGNPHPTDTALVDVYIGGIKRNGIPYSIAPGQRIYPRYGINAGPVHVVSTNNVNIFTSERTKLGESFNEVMGYPGNQLTSDYWFTSYDDVGMITYLVIGNPHLTDTAQVDVYIGGVKKNNTPYLIAPGQRIFPRFATNAGPVHVVSANNVDIFTSERSKFKQSFNEVMGYPGDQVTTDYWFTSYDDTSMITYLVIGNPHTTLNAEVDVYIGGVKKNTVPYIIAPGQRVFPRFAINSGPVHVVSTNSVNIFTSERSKYLNSFNEILGIANNQLTTDYWFTSYDNIGMLTDLVIAAPAN